MTFPVQAPRSPRSELDPFEFTLTDSLDQVAAVCRRCAQAEWLAFDTETVDPETREGSLAFYSGQILGVALAVNAEHGWYIPLNHPETPVEFRDAAIWMLSAVFGDPHRFYIAHNGKFDLKFLRAAGISVAGPLIDSMVMAQALFDDGIDGEPPKFSLGYLAKKLLDIEMNDAMKLGRGGSVLLDCPHPIHTATDVEIDGVAKHCPKCKGKGRVATLWGNLSAEQMCRYAAQDATTAYHLAEVLANELRARKVMPVPDVDVATTNPDATLWDLYLQYQAPLAAVLADMEYTGLPISSDATETLKSELIAEQRSITAQIHEIAGGNVPLTNNNTVRDLIFGTSWNEETLMPPWKPQHGTWLAEQLRKIYPDLTDSQVALCIEIERCNLAGVGNASTPAGQQHRNDRAETLAAFEGVATEHLPNGIVETYRQICAHQLDAGVPDRISIVPGWRVEQRGARLPAVEFRNVNDCSEIRKVPEGSWELATFDHHPEWVRKTVVINDSVTMVHEAGASTYLTTKPGFAAHQDTPQTLTKRSVDAESLKEIIATHSGDPDTPASPASRVAVLARLILDERQLATVIGYLESWLKYTSGDRLYGTFTQTGTRTGRLSSSNPNLQNIPAHGRFGDACRKLFRASKGHKMIVLDYSQIELRVMASLAKDQTLIPAFLNNEDPHRFTAAKTLGVPLEDISKADRAVGKAQPLDAAVLTPDGWTTMRDIHVGSDIIGRDGRPHPVVGVFPQGNRPVWRVELADGGTVEADEDHVWLVLDSETNEEFLITTGQLVAAGLSDGSGNIGRYHLPVCEPVHYGSVPHLPPGIRDTNTDPELFDFYNAGWHLATGACGATAGPGLIPAWVLRGEIHWRWVVLDGMCARATCATDANGSDWWQWSVTSESFASDLTDLVRGLGGIATVDKANGRYVVMATLPWRFCNEDRELSGEIEPVVLTRPIVSVTYVGETPTKCIAVASQDHLYLTDGFTVTHNTLNYAVLYGAGPYRVARETGKTKEEAVAILRDFEVAYPDIYAWVHRANRFVDEYGFYPTVLGRHRHFPSLQNLLHRNLSQGERRELAEIRRKISNSAIQGSAADIMMATMVAIHADPDVARLGVELVCQVHDELVFEVPTPHADAALSLLRHLMETTFTLPNGVPIVASGVIGDSWHAAKE